jgi:hypothetical protein
LLQRLHFDVVVLVEIILIDFVFHSAVEVLVFEPHELTVRLDQERVLVVGLQGEDEFDHLVLLQVVVGP